MFLLEYLYLTLLGAAAGIGLAMIVVLPLHDVIKQSIDMPYKFIGMGNMARAIASGFAAAGVLRGEEMAAYAPRYERLKAFSAILIACGTILR